MSRIRLDRLIVFDVEKTCWEGDAPPGQRSEIIEIGLAELQLGPDPAIGRTARYLVRPVASQVSAYCTQLTGLTQREVRQGRPLGEVLSTMSRQFGSAGKCWAAWGRDDQDLTVGCTALGIAPPNLGGFLDLGGLWSMFAGGGRAVGLEDALHALGMAFEGVPHRALDDARNTARVFLGLRHLLPSVQMTARPANEGVVGAVGFEPTNEPVMSWRP